MIDYFTGTECAHCGEYEGHASDCPARDPDAMDTYISDAMERQAEDRQDERDRWIYE